MLRLILGRAGSGKTETVMRDLCARGGAHPQILIVPEQQSHQAERRLCRAGGSGVSLFAEVLSFSRLANRIFLTAGGLGEGELEPGGRILLLHRAVKSMESHLTVLRRASIQPRFLQSLLDTVDELKSACATPGDLDRAGREAVEGEGEKLRDLALICGAYEALTSRVALDPRDRLIRAAQRLESCPWGEGKEFWLDGFTDFTPQQLSLVRLLLRQGEGMTVTLACDSLEGEEDIFTPARRTAWQLQKMVKELGVGCQIQLLTQDPREKVPALRHLERTLFSNLPPQPEPNGEGLALFSAHTMRGETEWTAAQILRLVREEGYRFRDIGVTARAFDGYWPLIQSVFSRYGVPVFGSRMSDILEKPVLTLVVGALDTVTGGYSYETLFRYLKTGLTGLEDEERDLLENYALKWNLRGSAWTQGNGWCLHPRGYGYPMTEEDEALLKRLDEVRRQVVAPLETLRRHGEKTGKGHAAAVYGFLEEIGLFHTLQQRLEALHRRGQAALAEEYRQLWEILCRALEQCAALLGDAPMEMEEFSSLFSLVLSQYQVGTIPVSLDRVSAGELRRMADTPVKVLFLLGAEDGSLPMAEGDRGLLCDDDRSLLASFGIQVGQTGEERLIREMADIYRVCALPQKGLTVSWPAVGTGGEELRPSFLVERLRRIFPALPVIREEGLNGEFRLAAPLPALEQAGHNDAAARALGRLEQYAGQVERLREAGHWMRGELRPETVQRLYGKRLPMSASRLDKLQSCHFSYFMQYGLRAQPRRPADFSAPEYGTFVHYVLERVLKWAGESLDPGEGARGRGELTADQREMLWAQVDRVVEDYVRDELGGMEHQTERFRYLFRRLRRAVRTVAENALEEVRASDFRPIAFELGFGGKGDLPPVEFTVDGVTVSISGFVDRVDGWVHNGRLYLRLVDYKTGKKSFDMTEVLNGMGLQMLLYLFALKGEGEAFFGRPVEPAGVLYFPARDVVVKGSRAMDDAQWKKLLTKELRRQGLVLDDEAVLGAMEVPGDEGYRFLPLRLSKSSGVTGDALTSAARFGRLQRHIQRVLQGVCQELAAGKVAADPFWRGPEKNACQYCDYVAACHFEEGRGGDCRRWLEGVSAAEFWARLEGEGS